MNIIIALGGVMHACAGAGLPASDYFSRENLCTNAHVFPNVKRVFRLDGWTCRQPRSALRRHDLGGPRMIFLPNTFNRENRQYSSEALPLRDPRCAKVSNLQT